MNRSLQSALNRLNRRIGRSGLFALALLAVAAVLALVLPELTRRTDDLRAALAARADAMARPAPPVRRTMTNGEQLLEYVSGFPPLSQNASDLERVFGTARQRNVELLRGEYQLKAEPNAPLVTYTATFPVHNDYGALKQFTADVLTALPHVSMDELRMARTDAGTGVLDSVVRFTFIYRRP